LGRQRYEAFVAERGAEATDEEFLRLIARHYYEVIGKETRRLMPDSIIFGECYGLSITPSFVVEEAAPWIDAVAIQPYGNGFRLPNSTAFIAPQVERGSSFAITTSASPRQSIRKRCGHNFRQWTKSLRLMRSTSMMLSQNLIF